jgi:hypothetical protein
LPEQTLQSWAVAISSGNAEDILRQLRLGKPAVFARVQDGCVLIDMRTVLPADEDALLARLCEASAEA